MINLHLLFIWLTTFIRFQISLSAVAFFWISEIMYSCKIKEARVCM